MAVSRKGKEVVDAKSASVSGSCSGGKRKRPLSASVSFRGSASGQKKIRAPSSRFIDDAAIDADSDEFVDDDDSDGVSAEEDPEFTNDIQAGANDTKGAGKPTIPLFLKEEELSGDELEEFVKERYGPGSDHVIYEEEDNECDERKSLLHSMADPTIWRVRCMVGHERHMAFCLIQKYVSLHVLGSNLPIISVFALEHNKGYVYVEADKQHDVIEACKGFSILYTSKIGLVPKNEVPRLLSVQNKSSEIVEGMWVRMKNGKYKGDLTQVMAVDAVRKRATIRVVPRIDLQALAKKFGGGISLKQAATPAPRLISTRELEDFRPHIEIRHDRETGETFEILDGLMLKDGYLYKKVSFLSLSWFGVQPLSAELLKFEPAKRDEPQVSEYLSNLYGGHKEKKEMLDDNLEDNGSAFKLHDLVLFRRKDFGVIIAMKCDGFQILKGGVEEPEVVNVQRREIRSSCIDKMFTASDSRTKTICINDVVKVLEGPQKDRHGIVKHMYKGSLFIYDDESLENTGFFCVKSELCEVMKDCHKNTGKSCHVGSKGFAECSSVPQSPTKCSEQRGYDSGFKYRQGDGDQPFTIGQTLRIRVGPLKGYLCRVVRICRSDVTVKLDSLVKLITVNSKHLSDANIRTFGNARSAMPKADESGSHERLSKGELADGDGEHTSWDFELPSSTRVSWPGLPTWGSSSANCDDNKACNDQGDDPWGSKVSSGDRCQAGNSAQNSQPATVDGWNSGAKAEKSNEDEQGSWNANSATEGEKGGWSKAMSSNHGQADSWNTGAGASGRSTDKGDWGGHTERPGCFEAEQGSGSNCAKPTTDDWSKQAKAEKSTEDELKNWNRGVGAGAVSDDKGDWGSHTDRSGFSEAGQGSGSAWAKATADGWSNQSKAEKSSEDKHEKCKGKSINEGETGGWNKVTSSNHGLEDSWNRSAFRESDGKSDWGSNTDKPGQSERGQGFQSNWGKASTDGCGNWDKAVKSTECEQESWKGNNKNESESGGWTKGTPSKEGQVDVWNKGSSSSWAKATTGGWSNLNKADKATEGKNESWKGTNINEGETGGWSKSRSSKHDQEDRWKRGAGVDGEYDGKVNWGQGFGCGSGGNRGDLGDRSQGGGWNKRLDTGGVCGSSWHRGRSRGNEVDQSGDKQDCWNRSRDSDGHRGRGRGRNFGGLGRGRNQDNSWSSGRGRGTRGRGVWEGRGSRADYNDSSHSGYDGKDHSLDWRNDQGSSGHGDFSGNALSSWKSDQQSGWGSSAAFGKDEALDNKRDKNHSWGGKDPSFGGASGWNCGSEGHTATGNECVSREGWDHQKPSGHGSNWSRQESGWGCSNSPNPSSAGKEACDWHNEEGSNWNRPKHFGGRHSSGHNWSVGDGTGRNNDRSGDWSGGKSCGDDQSCGWKGNMPSGRGNGRGRGRGKCFGQEHASGWSIGTRSNQEVGREDAFFSDREESYGRSKSMGWIHNKFADRGSGSRDGHGGWSGGNDLSRGQSGDAKKGDGGEQLWRQEAKGTWESWDSGTGNQASGLNNLSDRNKSVSTSGWTSNQGDSHQLNSEASAPIKGATTSQDTGWDPMKCFDGAQTSDVWKSDKTPSASEVCQGKDNWNKSKGFDRDAATGWNSSLVQTKKATSGEDPAWNRKDSGRPEGHGGWGNSGASFEKPRQNTTHEDAWSRESPRDGSHGSSSRSGWERSKDGNEDNGGW